LATTLIAGAALSVMGGTAFAQTKPACDKPDANGNCPTSQDVVVTGSRIKRNAFTAPDPITVITAEQATLAGYADTASLLQQSSIASGSFQTNDQLTGFVVTGGPGSKTLNLRRLGANRTIILLDGKRLGPAGVGGTVGPVDLNVIAQSSVAKIVDLWFGRRRWRGEYHHQEEPRRWRNLGLYVATRVGGWQQLPAQRRLG
jgi:iron complex outermembrane receptor protein